MAASDGTRNGLTVVRVFQILTLICCWGILAALVNVYNSNHIVAPAAILCLFVVAILASIWAFCILITQLRARNTALWMAVFDILFMAALIAGVILLSNVTTSRCIGYQSTTVIYDKVTGAEIWKSQDANGNTMWNSQNNHCDLAKAALGLGIANIILFFISAILSIIVYQQNKREDEALFREKVYTRRESAQYVGRSPSHRRHRHRHRDPRTGEYIVEERTV